MLKKRYNVYRPGSGKAVGFVKAYNEVDALALAESKFPKPVKVIIGKHVRPNQKIKTLPVTRISSNKRT